VIREDRALQDNLLEELNQLVGKVGGHKCLDCDGDVLRVLGLGQGSLHHLVNQGPPVLVLVIEHLCPQLHVTPLYQVAGLGLEQAILIADGDQLPITVAPLVGLAGQVRVTLLAVAAHHLAVIILVLHEEPLRVVVRVNVNFGQGVVGGWLSAALVDPGLQPGKN